MRYLGIEPKKPRVAVFDLTGCEGCELQLANKEETLIPFLEAMDIVTFREISSSSSDTYDVAFIDGCVTRADEVERLTEIRERASVLVAMGSCACFGGVNRMKDQRGDLGEVHRAVYGDGVPLETLPTRAVKEVVPVDLELPGCPVDKAEVERAVTHLVWDLPFALPSHPVCYECKQNFTVCGFERGQLCVGPVTRGGCRAPCPAGGLACWGCRGPAPEANLEELVEIARRHGYGDRELEERLGFFGGFSTTAMATAMATESADED